MRQKRQWKRQRFSLYQINLSSDQSHFTCEWKITQLTFLHKTKSCVVSLMAPMQQLSSSWSASILLLSAKCLGTLISWSVEMWTPSSEDMNRNLSHTMVTQPFAVCSLVNIVLHRELQNSCCCYLFNIHISCPATIELLTSINC